MIHRHLSDTILSEIFSAELQRVPEVPVHSHLALCVKPVKRQDIAVAATCSRGGCSPSGSFNVAGAVLTTVVQGTFVFNHSLGLGWSIGQMVGV